jgi:hypothetical protein
MRGEELFLIFTVLAGSIWLLTPVARALGERIKPRPPEAAGRGEFQRLREELTEDVGQLRREVAELGERLDFAERLLAKQPQALPRPGS